MKSLTILLAAVGLGAVLGVAILTAEPDQPETVSIDQPRPLPSLAAPNAEQRHYGPANELTGQRIDESTRAEVVRAAPEARVETFSLNEPTPAQGPPPLIDADALSPGARPVVTVAAVPVVSDAKPGLAVLPIQIVGPITRPEHGAVLANLLLPEIDSAEYALIERGQLEALLEEQRFQQSDLVSDRRKAAHFGRIVGIRYLVVGELNRLGGDYHLTARMVDCTTGEIAGKGKVSFGVMHDANNKLRELVARLGLNAAPVAAQPNPQAGAMRLGWNIDLLDHVNPAPAFDVSVRTADGKTQYREGEAVSFEVTAGHDTFLTVVSIDVNGDMTLLLPNEYAPGAYAFARRGEVVEIPSKDAGFKFTAQPPYGATMVRVFVTTRPLKLRPARNAGGFKALGNAKALGVQAAPGLAQAHSTNLAEGDLLKQFAAHEWATAELIIQTYDRNGPPPQPDQEAATQREPDQNSASVTGSGAPLSLNESSASSGGLLRPSVGAEMASGDDANAAVWNRWMQLNNSVLRPSPRLIKPGKPALAAFDGVIVVRQGDGGRGNAGTKGVLRTQMSTAAFQAGGDFRAEIQRLEAQDDVLVAVPNYEMSLFELPRTHYASVQWALENRFQPGMDIGWYSRARQSGGELPLIAVVDHGFVVNDPRLSSTIWTNPGEIAGNGRDDDGNGLVDDVRGYNFATRSPGIEYPQADLCHGAFVASIIAAEPQGGRNDVIGMLPGANILCIVAVGANGRGSTQSILESIEYAADQGAKIINLSLGGHIPQEDLARLNQLPLWDRLERDGVLLVCAAGNNHADIDRHPIFPASLPRDNVIAVMAVDPSGQPARAKTPGADDWAPFSNYGKDTVDLAAPGALMLGIPRDGRIDLIEGTSFAAPVVTAACAGLWAESPGLSPAQIKARVLANVKPLPALRGRCTTEGMLDLTLK